MSNIIKKDIIFHRFQMQIFGSEETDIDLEELSKNFELDVEQEIVDYNINNITNSTKGTKGTIVRQKINGQLIDRSFEICSTRLRNQKINYKPTGFIKSYYAETPTKMNYLYPTKMIPIGCWCNVCDAIGPLAHDNTCSYPKYESLNLTLEGFLKCKTKLRFVDIIFLEYLEQFMEIIKKDSRKDIINIIDNLSEPMQRALFVFKNNNIVKNLTNIPYSTVFKISNKDKNQLVSNSLLLTYSEKNESNVDKEVSIRISKNGGILIVSNPWENVYLYEKIIERANKNLYRNNRIVPTKFKINSGFSSVKFLNDNYIFDIKKIYKWFWPMDGINNISNDIRQIFRMEKNGEETQNSYLKLKNSNFLYKYNVSWNKTQTNLEFIFEKHFITRDNTVDEYNYEIKVPFFSQGHIQLTFNYIDKNIEIEENIDEQLKLIKEFMTEIYNILLEKLEYIYSKDNSIIVLVEKEISDKIFPTVVGSMLNGKSKKKIYKLGSRVNLFDNGIWSTDIWEVVKIDEKDKKNRKKDKNNTFSFIQDDDMDQFTIVKLKEQKKDEYIKTDEYITTYKKNLRLESGDSGTAVSGEQFRPTPYSFYGSCKKPNSQWINPIGVQSWNDNRFYPTCEDIKQDDSTKIKDKMIKFLLDGFTQEEIEFGNISVGFDNNTGTFKQDIKIGDVITIKDDDFNYEIKNKDTYISYTRESKGEDSVDVVVLDIKKQAMHEKNNGKKYQIVYYFVKELNDDNNIFVITGEDFADINRESRYFPGIRNMFDGNENLQKKILINCAEKLNLIKPKLIIDKNLEDIDNVDLQKNIINAVFNLYEKNNKSKNIEDIRGKTELLNMKNIKKLTERKYYVSVVPHNSTRTLLCIFEKEQYLINDDFQIMKINVLNNNENLPIIIDGYIDAILNYYPINILYMGKKVGKEGNSYEKRLEILDDVLYKIPKSSATNSINIIPTNRFISDDDIIDFIKEEFKTETKKILFIPETMVNFIEWNKINIKQSIVLTIVSINKDFKGIQYILGNKKIGKDSNGKDILNFSTITPLNNYTYLTIKNNKNIVVEGKIGDSIRVNLNFDKQGKLIPGQLYYSPILVDDSEFLGFSKTQNNLFQLLYPIDEKMFIMKNTDNTWILGDISSTEFQEKDGMLIQTQGLNL